MLPTPPAYVYRQEGPLRDFCASHAEALLAVAQRPSSSPVAQRGPLRHPAQQPLFATRGEGLLGALCARGELELAPRVTCSLYTHHTPQQRTQLTGHRDTIFAAA